ncbi:hypothetical protein Vadar_020899 [Vaccinium darrowii]|uniref:Uncharacterized protein n=1 Tax=Vaccinium darrowii TaxID=229202 RepID=A0ACB7ZE29_9ERIC|nr:hypothetical protein Vadar_020899 [Vaccinium darrowii]
MSDSSTIDECQEALLSLSLGDSSRSGGIPSDSIVVHQPQPQAHMQEKLKAPTTHFDSQKWLLGTGPGSRACYNSYVDAAFCSSTERKAYLFMGNEYVVLDCSQRPSRFTVLEGPLPICKRFPFLSSTSFVDDGLDAAFESGEDEAIFFLEYDCAKVNYSPNPSYDLKPITEMFPFLECTLFESHVDAALESWKRNEAFLFKDDQCACINYSADNCRLVDTIRPIAEFFPILKGTFFESGIQSAFAKSITSCYEVVLFKKECWAWINFGPLNRPFDTPLIHIGNKLFSAVRCILPRTNGGLDGHDIIHCGCVPKSSIGTTRRIYSPMELEWLRTAMERERRSGKCVAVADLCRALEEAKANKSNIGS